MNVFSKQPSSKFQKLVPSTKVVAVHTTKDLVCWEYLRGDLPELARKKPNPLLRQTVETAGNHNRRTRLNQASSGFPNKLPLRAASSTKQEGPYQGAFSITEALPATSVLSASADVPRLESTEGKSSAMRTQSSLAFTSKAKGEQGRNMRMRMAKTRDPLLYSSSLIVKNMIRLQKTRAQVDTESRSKSQRASPRGASAFSKAVRDQDIPWSGRQADEPVITAQQYSTMQLLDMRTGQVRKSEELDRLLARGERLHAQRPLGLAADPLAAHFDTYQHPHDSLEPGTIDIDMQQLLGKCDTATLKTSTKRNTRINSPLLVPRTGLERDSALFQYLHQQEAQDRGLSHSQAANGPPLALQEAEAGALRVGGHLTAAATPGEALELRRGDQSHAEEATKKLTQRGLPLNSDIYGTTDVLQSLEASLEKREKQAAAQEAVGPDALSTRRIEGPKFIHFKDE